MTRLILRRSRAILIGLLIVVAAVVCIVFRADAVWLVERFTLFIAPTAPRAYQYGELHFNAQDTEDFNVKRAQFFFEKAAFLDPAAPYTNHELARIYFLKGDFKTALSLIDVQIANQGDRVPNSYYVRGLIEGYMGLYTEGERDYAHYLQFDPTNWAAMNDLAWIYLKDNDPLSALKLTQRALQQYPDNPWLLNSNSIALYETGHLSDALSSAEYASRATSDISNADWLRAYPGNDPSFAAQGVESLRNAIDENIHSIQTAIASSTLQ